MMNKAVRTGLRRAVAVRSTLLIVLVLLTLVACSGGPPKEFPAPDFTVKDVFAGSNITLSSFRGRPVLLYFFASW